MLHFVTCVKNLFCHPKVFDGRGVAGPKLIITDDNQAERNSLSTTWPEADWHLCTHHYLKSLWSWLWDRNHSISNLDRKILMILFRKILYAKTREEFDVKVRELEDNEITQQ